MIGGWDKVEGKVDKEDKEDKVEGNCELREVLGGEVWSAAHVVGEEVDGVEDVDNLAVQLLPLPFPDLQLCLRLVI